MRIRSTVLPLVAALVLFAASPADAQTRRDSIELSPYAGYIFGGELDAGSSGFPQSTDVDDDGGFGLRLGYNVNDVFGIELSYLHENTELISEGDLFEPDRHLADMDIDMLEGAMLFHMGNNRIRPFFSMGLGMTRMELDREGTTSDTRLRSSLGGGLKLYFARQFGFRFDVKSHFTWVDGGDGGCYDTRDHYDDCGDGDVLMQTEVSAGFVFAF